LFVGWLVGWLFFLLKLSTTLPELIDDDSDRCLTFFLGFSVGGDCGCGCEGREGLKLLSIPSSFSFVFVFLLSSSLKCSLFFFFQKNQSGCVT